MKKAALILLCFHNVIFISAQQYLGIRNSNYAGIQGACLNPSSIADSKFKWDINVASTNTVFDNTFLYIPRDSLHVFGFKKVINDIIHETDFFTHFDLAHPNKLYDVTFSNELLGPSFMINIGERSSIGLTTASRAYVNISSITGHFAENAFAYLQYQDLWKTTFHDNTAKLNLMSWLEYGLNYATVIYAKDRNEFKGGITLKYLQGIAAAYFKNTDLTYNIIDTTQLVFTQSYLNYGRTNYNSLINTNGSGNLINGNGFGANIGFTYTRLRNPYKEYEKKIIDEGENNYVYRIGISVIDLGAINFNKNTATFHLETDSANFLNWKHTHIANNIQFDKIISAVFYHNDSTRSFVSDHFGRRLPAAISLQADWNFYKNFFINATIVKSIGHGSRQGAIRPDVYSLTARYEKKWFELSIPISLLYYGHWQSRVGLAARIYYFFIGGDALGSLLKLNDFEVTDFYVGVHFFVAKKKGKHTE
jgi:hypothetical protein